MIRATIDGLKKETSPRLVAQRRGKKLSDLMPRNIENINVDKLES